MIIMGPKTPQDASNIVRRAAFGTGVIGLILIIILSVVILLSGKLQQDGVLYVIAIDALVVSMS